MQIRSAMPRQRSPFVPTAAALHARFTRLDMATSNTRCGWLIVCRAAPHAYERSLNGRATLGGQHPSHPRLSTRARGSSMATRIAVGLILGLSVTVSPEFTKWSAPRAVGAPVNTTGVEGAPYLSNNGLSL